MEDFHGEEDHRLCCSSFSKPNRNKRRGTCEESQEERDVCGGKRRSIGVARRALVNLKHLDLPLLSAATASTVHSLRLRPRRRPYYIGRHARCCDFVFADRRVSSRHCQILFDPLFRKIYLKELRVSLNGVFVNGIRLRRGGSPVELSAGDEVSLVCPNSNCCNSPVRVGFVIESVVFEEKIVSRSTQLQSQSQSQSQGSVSSRKGNKRVYASKVDEDCEFSDVINRAKRLLSQCAGILRSDDPVLCIQESSNIADCLSRKNGDVITGAENYNNRKDTVFDWVGKDCSRADYTREESVLNCLSKDCSPLADGVAKKRVSTQDGACEPPGKRFYLNRLKFMDNGSSSHPTDVSLPELLHPVESISQMFIATFTSAILWFLSFCEIPRNVPVTIACHSTERCWNSSPDKRTSVPDPDFPNLVVVYPMFPEEIAFGKDLKKQGIGCHHPKLFVVQRDDYVRVIITSANLVPTQWNSATNTIWWQDFPRRSSPNYMALFTQIHIREINQGPKSDFCSQLTGFIASLLNDVPSQAHWIFELTKYDFGGATAELVASVPGIHSYRAPNVSSSTHFLQRPASTSGVNFLGSVEASVVGLSYLFHKAADSNGAQLKKLASFMEKSENADGLSEVHLKRIKTIRADENAVSIFVPSPTEFHYEDCVQLGFLPRKVAKWVSPLWDVGFFRFSAYVCHTQALSAALGGSYKRVSLSIHVSQGPNFENITKMMQPEHIVALCSMIAAIQRCSGLWRLQEVLAQYKWPEELQSDFIYSASSIGSINARFLAAFSAAAGKTSSQFDSDESDPEWGCWSTSQELKNPSIRVLFPTITRVKNAINGVLPSKRILCFSERTWERLRGVDILHDAIPHPYNRVGHPMHIKVARRCFKSRENASSSFGWVYCGSHNFSAAAWGRPVSTSHSRKIEEDKTQSSSSDLKLHICNYELGVVFTFPPTETKSGASKSSMDLDGVVLPFVVPAPKYGPRDRPATAKAMREALVALKEIERQHLVEVEVPNEEELAEDSEFVAEEKEEEKVYANMLWNHIHPS